MKRISLVKSVAMFVMVIMIAASLSTKPVKAASYDYTRTGTKTVTFTVTTKAAWYYPGKESVTFKNYKCTFVNRKFSIFKGWYDSKSKKYPSWTIKAESTDGTHKVTKTMSGSSKKIKLKRNKKYRFTVSYGEFNWTKGITSAPQWSIKGLWKATMN